VRLRGEFQRGDSDRKLFTPYSFTPKRAARSASDFREFFNENMIEIIPAIDLIDGKCVRFRKAISAQKNYNENPLERRNK
jgi:hypothetical protein